MPILLGLVVLVVGGALIWGLIYGISLATGIPAGGSFFALFAALILCDPWTVRDGRPQPTLFGRRVGFGAWLLLFGTAMALTSLVMFGLTLCSIPPPVSGTLLTLGAIIVVFGYRLSQRRSALSKRETRPPEGSQEVPPPPVSP